MTSSTYPEQWLNDRRIRGLTDPGHRLLVLAMTYSAANLTDGYLDDGDLTDLLSSHALDPAALAELEARGLIEPAGPGRIYLTEFRGTQTSAATVRAAAAARVKKSTLASARRAAILAAAPTASAAR